MAAVVEVRLELDVASAPHRVRRAPCAALPDFTFPDDGAGRR